MTGVSSGEETSVCPFGLFKSMKEVGNLNRETLVLGFFWDTECQTRCSSSQREHQQWVILRDLETQFF
jgi:hypothetical protein